MPARPYILAETNWKTVQETNYEVAMLPWGATEAHNYHLPYATDNLQCDYLAAEAARHAWQAGAKVIVLPTIPFGVQTGQLNIPLCINMNPSTQLAVLRDVATCLDGVGIKKLAVLNGHGGNDFRQMIRELQPQVKMFLCTVNWYRAVPREPFFAADGDHGDEMETSLIQHIAPDWVRPLSEAGDGHTKKFRLAAFREGWAWAPRQWTQVTADTGDGDAAAVAERLGQFLIELAAANVNDLYE
jgi:creatinine amidohydrolase